VADYIPFEEVLAEALEDPEVRAEWDRTRLAREVSNWIVFYRQKHRLTQTELARILGWQQSVVARLESGDREPSFATLHRLAERLGATARIDISPFEVHIRFTKRTRPRVQTKADGGTSHLTRQRTSVVPSTELQPV
jgi:transcriptional regulator with XRE-family HTH domain